MYTPFLCLLSTEHLKKLHHRVGKEFDCRDLVLAPLNVFECIYGAERGGRRGEGAGPDTFAGSQRLGQGCKVASFFGFLHSASHPARPPCRQREADVGDRRIPLTE